MKDNRVTLEIFHRYYTSLCNALKNEDYEKALKDLCRAAKVLYGLAKESTGEDRANYLKNADRLYSMIPSIKKKMAEAKTAKAHKPAHAPKPEAASSRSSAAKPASGKPAAISGESVKKDSSLSAENRILGKSSNTGNDNGGSNSEEGEDQAVFKAMDIPNVSFDDVVGLYEVKEAIRKKVIEPRLYPEIFEKYKMKVGGGVLMYGPPGTGKTMIAKAIAREVGAKFFAVRCSTLVSKYFGGTEQNIQLLFDTARKEENSVIFFDEFDALAVSRDKTRSSVMRRVVTELLTQMQGVNDDNNKNGHSLLILAATNTPWMMDTAFLRPGRFDERIYVGLPDFDARRGILERALSDIPQIDLDLNLLAEKCEGFNCSDVAQLVQKAKTHPVEREKTLQRGDALTMEDFEAALLTCHSSVAKADIERIFAWKEENG